MSINISGKNEKLWKNERQSRNGGTWFDYSISVSKKAQNGNYVNAYMKVKFSSKLTIPSELPNGAQMDFDGFLTPDVYTDRNGQEVKRTMIMVTDVKFHDVHGDDSYDSYNDYDGIDSFSQAEDDIPF